MTKHALVLEASGLDAGYGRTAIVHDATVRIPPGKITVILGANACGKSTLLKTFVRVLKPLAGSVVLDGRDVAAMPSKELARQLGLLPSSRSRPRASRCTTSSRAAGTRITGRFRRMPLTTTR